MHARLHIDQVTESLAVSTGALPRASFVGSAVIAAFERYRTVDDGEVADFVAPLASARRDLFGLCIAGTTGATWAAGDREHCFSMQSIARPFVFALVCQALGARQLRGMIGVNNTGLPLVTAGAIATTSLAPGDTVEAKWRFIHEGLSRFAGRTLDIDEEVYRRGAVSQQRLASPRRIFSDPVDATEVYTRQCSLKTNAEDLAVMGATLADGGVNPRTGERVIDAERCQRVLAVLANAGMYEQSGDWLYETGLPAKSSVSGGIVAVVPGKAGLAAFSPPLDSSGNSVRGQLAIRFLSERLGLNLFASRPAV